MSKRNPTPAKPDRRGLRCCGVCRQYRLPTEMLIRLTVVVRTDDGYQLVTNPTGTLPGRSVYVCSEPCWQKAQAKPQRLLYPLRKYALPQAFLAELLGDD